MNDNLEFLQNYLPDTLYVHPVASGKGTYTTLVGVSEHPVGEIDVTSRCKLAVTAFHVADRGDFGTVKLTKMQYHRTYGWQAKEHITLNQFQLAQMKEFISILSSLDLGDATKTKIALGNIHLGALGSLLSSSKGAAIIQELASSPDLHQDIYAVAAKRAVLTEFENNLSANLSEPEWQKFFERNPWIFGHGLNYVFLNKVGPKLETRTTGSAFDRPGKRADGLMLTRAEVSQYVLVEIKTNDTGLLKQSEYRSGCWGVSYELSDAVTQTQKTVSEFSRSRFRDHLKDDGGNLTGEIAYSVDPRSYLVIGNLSELSGNDDKVACFELYRRNMRAPEILTFDELFQRASCIVENISREHSSSPSLGADPDPIPF